MAGAQYDDADRNPPGPETAASDGASPSALDLLLQPETTAPPTPKQLDATGMRARMAELNNGWADR